MKTEGPALESLLHRLTETPEDFLAEPRIGGSGKVNVAAVIGDCFAPLGISVPPAHLTEFGSHESNRQSISLLLAWLLAEPWFREQKISAGDVMETLAKTSAELSPHVNARRFVEDPDRREELARFTLARLDLRPAGESIAQAQDRLTTISTAERSRVMIAARAAEERLRAIREELARKAAEESADKFTRE